jgi:diadenosine tetraphosphate (Ap4A) HIT family hydrolase
VTAVFALDPRLQNDTLPIGEFPLCRLLLSNDSNYLWLILVPRIAGISEVFQLDAGDQSRLWAKPPRWHSCSMTGSAPIK